MKPTSTQHMLTYLVNWSSLTSENWRDKIRNAKFPEGSGVTMHDISDDNERRRNASARKEILRKYVQDSAKKVA